MSTQNCLIVDIPGAKGATGAAGTNGADGINAFTLTTAGFVMPAEGAAVVVAVGETSWMGIGQVVFVGVPGGGARGTFRVAAKGSGTSVTLTNLADTALSEYLDNSPPGTVFAGASVVAPSGLQGPPGVNGTSGAAADATFWTSTPHAGLSAEVAFSGLGTGLVKNTGGTPSIVPVGNADLNVPFVDEPAGLIAGEAVFANGAGILTKNAAAARTALGLGTMAVQDANAVNITGGSITGVSLPGPTALFPKDYLLFQHQVATGGNAGAFNQGSWVTVPLTTEVADTGNYGSIAGNTVTLAAGTYRARWRVCGLQVDSFQSRLYNVTGAAVVAYGGNAEAASTDASSAWSLGDMRFAIGVATQLRLEAQCGTTNGTTGFGKANSFGADEVYAALELEREAS